MSFGSLLQGRPNAIGVRCSIGSHITRLKCKSRVKRSFYAHRHARSPEEEAEVRERADALFLERWRLVEQHLQASGPFYLGDRFSLVDIYLLVSSTWSHNLIRSHLAAGEFPAIEECVRRSAERPRIAPIHAEHLKGLERIDHIGVPA